MSDANYRPARYWLEILRNFHSLAALIFNIDFLLFLLLFSSVSTVRCWLVSMKYMVRDKCDYQQFIFYLPFLRLLLELNALQQQLCIAWPISSFELCAFLLCVYFFFLLNFQCHRCVDDRVWSVAHQSVGEFNLLLLSIALCNANWILPLFSQRTEMSDWEE